MLSAHNWRWIAARRLFALIAVAAAVAGEASAGAPSDGEPLPGLVPAPARCPGIARWQLAYRVPRGRIYAIAWSPDGRRIVHSDASYLRICDAKTFETTRILAGHRGRVTSIDWSRSNQRIASAGFDEMVRIWSAEGVPQKALSGHSGDVNSVAWSPDGSRLASAGADGTLRIWSGDGSSIRVIDASSAAINSVAWSPDGMRLVAGDENHTVKIWNADGTAGPLCEGHLGRVTGVSWSRNGKNLASSTWGFEEEGSDKSVVDIRIWNSDGTARATAMADSPSFGLQWSPDGESLAVINERGELKLFGADAVLRSVRKADNIGGGLDEPSLAWSPDGREIALGGSGVVAIAAADGPPKSRTSPHSRLATILRDSAVAAVSADGGRAVTRSDVPTLTCILWDLATGSFRKMPEEVAASGVTDQSLSPAGERILFIEQGTQLKVWDSASNTSRVIVSAGQPLSNRAWSPTGDLIAYVQQDQTVHAVKLDGTSVLEWSSKRSAASRLANETAPLTLRWSDDGKSLVVSGQMAVEVVRLDGTVAASFGFKERMARYWVSPDGLRAVARLAVRGRPIVRSRKLGSEIVTFSKMSDDREMMSVSPDVQRIFFGMNSGAWEVRSFDDPSAVLQSASAHVNGSVLAIEVSPDGRRFATGGWDGVVRVWKLDGSLEKTLYGQSHPAHTLWWSRDGRQLTSLSRIQSLCQWSLDDSARRCLLFQSESGPAVLLLADGHVASSDPKLCAEELIAFIAKPDGATEIVDTAGFLNRCGLLRN